MRLEGRKVHRPREEVHETGGKEGTQAWREGT